MEPGSRLERVALPAGCRRVLWLRSTVVSGKIDAHFENRLWPIRISVRTDVAIGRVGVQTVVQFSIQRQAGPTRRLQRTLELFSPMVPWVGHSLHASPEACKERTLRRDSVRREEWRQNSVCRTTARHSCVYIDLLRRLSVAEFVIIDAQNRWQVESGELVPRLE